MAQLQILLLLLIFLNASVVLTSGATEIVRTNLVKHEVLSVRKFGKHHQLEAAESIIIVSTPSEAPQAEDNHSLLEVNGSGKHTEIGMHNHHHSVDMSVAGGGVILGGLATTFLVAVFCYIRATRRIIAEPIV